MDEPIKESVKELYKSVTAPSGLKEKTLDAINSAQPHKGKLIKINFKALSAFAACLVVCLGVLLYSNANSGGINVAVNGNSISSDAVICHTTTIEYSPVERSLSPNTAVKLEVDFKNKTSVSADNAVLAVNDNGTVSIIDNGIKLKGEHIIYVITGGEKEIEVTFTDKKGTEILVIAQNSDGSYSVRIK